MIDCLSAKTRTGLSRCVMFLALALSMYCASGANAKVRRDGRSFPSNEHADMEGITFNCSKVADYAKPLDLTTAQEPEATDLKLLAEKRGWKPKAAAEYLQYLTNPPLLYTAPGKEPDFDAPRSKVSYYFELGCAFSCRGWAVVHGDQETIIEGLEPSTFVFAQMAPRWVDEEKTPFQQRVSGSLYFMSSVELRILVFSDLRLPGNSLIGLVRTDLTHHLGASDIASCLSHY